MPDKIDSQRILCQGGLNTSENFLLLSNENPGYGVKLLNFETAVSGGYRRISGYDEITADPDDAEVTSSGDAAEGKILGVFGFVNSVSNTFQIIAARKLVSGNVYGFFLFDGIDSWSLINTGTTQSSTGVDLVRSESFSTQTGNWIVFVDGVNHGLAFDGTYWYEIESSNTGGNGSPGGDQCLDAPSVVMYFSGTLFFAGDPTYPAIVAYSAPGDPLTWTAASGGGQALPSFPVVAIKAFRDEGYIFGTNAICKLIPDLSVGFVREDVTDNLGCIARDSVLEVNSNIIFLAPDGVRTIAGTEKIGDVEIGPFSENIHNTINNVIDTFILDNIRSVVVRNKTQFRYFINNNVTSKDDAYGILGCANHNTKDWEFFEINGFQLNSTWSGYDEDGEEVILHGGFDGKIYQQELGNTFAGDNITAIYQSPYIDLGDTTVRKLFRRIDLFARLEGTLSASMEIQYDWGSEYAINPSAYGVDGTGNNSFYDTGVDYDSHAVYGGAAQPVFKINIQGSAYSIQMGLTSIGGAPYTLQGYVINYSVKGRE